MSAVEIAGIVFLCVGAGAALGEWLRRLLPQHHLAAESKELIKMGVGLIGTMTALVLGLLVASAKTSYDSMNAELTDVSAKVVLADRLLAHYGPETKEARAELRAAVEQTIARTWPAEGHGAPSAGNAESLYAAIQRLSPVNDSQRVLQSQVLGLVMGMGQTRWLMVEQAQSPMPAAFLVVVVLWLTVMFVSFGVLAPPNATTGVTLFLCALCVAAAIFLILELYTPFEGVIHISSAPLRYALATLGR